MKALPTKLVYGEGYIKCPVSEATHVTLNFPSPAGKITLPVMIGGTRKGTNCWTWNGDTEKPTLKPSVLTTANYRGLRCHSFVNDGYAKFLDDCSHELKGQTVELLDVEGV